MTRPADYKQRIMRAVRDFHRNQPRRRQRRSRQRQKGALLVEVMKCVLWLALLMLATAVVVHLAMR